MTARDFAKNRVRQRMSRKGAECVTGGGPWLGEGSPPRRLKSKIEARQEASALTSPSTMITKTIICRCGHKGKVRIPVARAEGPFRCVKCQTRKP
ncbi:hypothetical protein EDE05_102446 [Neorhizobium sp. R1-B]|nr:hypothetical protein EDE05_102446 [Neorhizobium sp. R1-B]